MQLCRKITQDSGCWLFINTKRKEKHSAVLLVLIVALLPHTLFAPQGRFSLIQTCSLFKRCTLWDWESSMHGVCIKHQIHNCFPVLTLFLSKGLLLFFGTARHPHTANWSWAAQQQNLASNICFLRQNFSRPGWRPSLNTCTALVWNAKWYLKLQQTDHLNGSLVFLGTHIMMLLCSTYLLVKLNIGGTLRFSWATF